MNAKKLYRVNKEIKRSFKSNTIRALIISRIGCRRYTLSKFTGLWHRYIDGLMVKDISDRFLIDMFKKNDIEACELQMYLQLFI